MYKWRTSTRPSPETDGQIHIDDHDNVWSWDATSSAWIQQKSMYIREVGQMRVPVYNVPTDANPLRGPMSLVYNEWDYLYTKAFVRTELQSNGFVEHLAWFNQEELGDYVSSILDKSGPFFQDVVKIKVYQAFDPSIRSDRSGHSNSLYALMRGRHAYNRRIGRFNEGLLAQTGLSYRIENPRYTDDWHVNTPQKFIQAFYGISDAPINPQANNIFYFQKGNDNFYHLPKVGTRIDLKDRWWYAPAVNSFTNVSGVVSASLGTPMFFGTNEWAGSVRSLQSMQTLCGNKFLSSGRHGVVVYPVAGYTNTGVQLRAFLVRPYGIDCVGLGLPSQYVNGDWQIVCENSYPDSFSKRHSVVSDRWIIPDNDLVTFKVRDVLKFGKSAAGSLNMDSSSIPKKLDFYLLNVNTGVRSENVGTGLQVVRRKTCMPVGILPAYRGNT